MPARMIFDDVSQCAGSAQAGQNIRAPMINYKNLNFQARKEFLKSGLD